MRYANYNHTCGLRTSDTLRQSACLCQEPFIILQVFPLVNKYIDRYRQLHLAREKYQTFAVDRYTSIILMTPSTLSRAVTRLHADELPTTVTDKLRKDSGYVLRYGVYICEK